MSIFDIARSLPSSVAPRIAVFVLSIGDGDNDTLLFITAAGYPVVAGLTTRPIQGVR